MNEKIIQNMLRHNQNLSSYACLDSQAIRLKKEKIDIRSDFFRDIDRIIYSLSYNRYLDKTQVYSLIDNDNISRRMTHVQLVSKVARTIGRALALNEDLIEAAALGHDLGHVPFGHAGETILNKISIENNEGYFNHNIQSVRNLMELEKNGQGKNLTIQVLDAIMCHNGEMASQELHPMAKTTDQFLDEYHNSYIDAKIVKHLVPMTLEGCVVRISDIIAYVGKDIEDAEMMGFFQKENIPLTITKVLGDNNRKIVNTLVMDIINNSLDQNSIIMSREVYLALINLKKFNYQEIYNKANSKEQIAKYELMFRTIFANCLQALRIKNANSNIYKVYLNQMPKQYLANNSQERIVIDYLAGMTDDYLINQYQQIISNK